MNIENLYKTIMDLEYPRHGVENIDNLNKAADYIKEKFESYGLKTDEHQFYVKGMPHIYRNIVADIGDKNKEAILIGAHYDSVSQSPGANDNLSGVAVMLEVARILGKLDKPPRVNFVAFTLEEGHPGYYQTVFDGLKEAGLVDETYRYLDKAKQSACWQVLNKAKEKSGAEGFKQEGLDEIQEIYASIMANAYETYEEEFFDGGKILIGSSKFVESYDMKIKEAIIFDCLGWIKDKQDHLPIPKEVEPLLKLQGVDLKEQRGDYITVLGDQASPKLLDSFIENFEMNYLGLSIPTPYEQIRHILPDALRSDHAPFWKKAIPALFVTDMANFRSELYHTPADQSFRIDYKILASVGKATLSYLMSSL